MARIGLMGGTFDPIHIGHLRVAEEVREELGLDRVVFIPAGNPVFKRGQHVTGARERLAQVRRAVADNPRFDVSDIEVARGGDTYTVDTLRELHARHPDDEFYFIMGSDAAETIGKWRGVGEIATLAHLVVAVGRPGAPAADELRETILAAAPFQLHVVKVTSLEISSSDIRRRLAEGKSVRYLVPEAVTGEILRLRASRSAQDDGGGGAPRSAQDGEGEGVRHSAPGGVADACPAAVSRHPERNGEPSAALSKEFYKARKAELARRVSPKRFEHTMGVAKTAKALAKRFGVDARKARLAGLLHDWDKGLDDGAARERVRELGLQAEIDPWVVEHMPRVLHGHTAARALARDFPEIPADVLQAIDRHTTAAVDMSDLDKVLYIADALEPNRTFGRIDELREAAKTATLDELYFQTYEYWTLLLFERRQPLHPDTMRIWNANALRWQAERERRGK